MVVMPSEDSNDEIKLPAVNEVKRLISDIEKIEEQKKEMKIRVYHSVLNLPLQIGDDPNLRDRVIRYLYWHVPDVLVKWLCEAFGFFNDWQIRDIAGTYSLSLKCEKCGTSLSRPVSSREEMKTRQSQIKRHEKYKNDPDNMVVIACDACAEALQREMEKSYQEERNAYYERSRELQAMTYQEYLKSPEWDEIRKEQLRRAGYRCQVCDARNVPLHVHHRTYDRRGHERYGDLLVLCENCHRLYHEQGKLREPE